MPTFLPMLENPQHSHSQSQPDRRDSTHLSSSAGTSKRAISTSYEPMTPPSDDNDPISRHPAHHSSSSSTDIENTPATPNSNDPYQLRPCLKTASELNLIRANTSRKRDGFGNITTNKAATKARRLQTFYETQNENIERWLKPVDEHVDDAKKLEGDNHLKYKIAIHGSFAANLLLAALQIFGAVSSGSLSLFTTMVDAVFDPLSNVTLIVCNRAVRKVDSRRFPSGKARIETVGNIMFCFLMTAVSFLIIVLSIMELGQGNYEPYKCDSGGKLERPPLQLKEFHLASSIAVGVACVVKTVLFLYCWSLRNTYSQIRILWEDHRNDIIINSLGLLTSLGGSFLDWRIDPIGAILLSCLISGLWLRTAYGQFLLLIGVSASTSLQQWITYICLTHDPEFIIGIDTVRAYHSGPRIIVEVDVVMDEGRRMGECHDVAEGLQMKLERLPDVERAYVHVDWEVSHRPEHFVKKEL
jgi:cation diffusion facilitator family transporter